MFLRYSSVSILGLLLLCASVWAKDSKLNTLYKDPNQLMNIRIKNLMDQMTLQEKIGQMTQIDRRAATAEIMRDYSIGSLLSGGGSVPSERATAEEWVDDGEWISEWFFV
ncbi:Glycosyl hydrolase family protein [Abeliophyllum distichum]|uniref:Glycosyl hydrolase family protein n=1 Tax=Abeliophyllum distichum TaxID=126358 RepID=A0ABD1TE48_9LAMI